MSHRIEKVIKRDGTVEDFAPEKLNGWAEYGCKTVDVSWSAITMAAQKTLPKGVVDSDTLMDALIKAAESLIKDNPAYDVPAKELRLAQMRKRLYDSFEPPSLRFFHDHMVSVGAWEDMSAWITDEQFEALNQVIDHDRDRLFTSGGLKQFFDKYSRRNIATGEIYETPQFAYMGMAMAMLSQPNWTILDAIDLYNAMSLHKINVPTPPLVGLRSSDRGFASCCLVDSTDTLDSIDTAEHIVFKMVAARAGIGYHLESRSIADPVRNGAFPHSGKLPYYRHIDRSVKANTQQTRGGSATVSYSYFDPEIIQLMQVKQQRATDENKIDKMDYSLSFNNLLLKRYLKNEDITLMSYFYAPEVHEAFYSDDEAKFEEIYVAAEKRVASLTKIDHEGKTVPAAPKVSAKEILDTWLRIRMETGRMYAHHIGESNRHGNFLDPIRMTNLCVEITQPTRPFHHITELYKTKEQLDQMKPEDIGEVSLCNLGGVVLGRMESLAEWEKTCYILLKFVDTIIEIQDYPFPTMEYTAKKRRNVGIGLMNAAGAMAAEGLAYEGIEARNWIHREAEKLSYFLHKASVRLAKEQGACEWFDRTKPSKGILVIDTYKKTVDELVSVGLEMDWESLRADILKYGMRNSVLTAQMPGESSSVLLGVTNSIEPPRKIVSIKGSAVNKVIAIAPGATDWETLMSYKLAYDVDRIEWIKWVATMQKFFSQSISTNMYYDYTKFENEIIPGPVVVRDFMTAVKYGWKTFYYANFNTENGGGAGEEAAGCASGGCTI
ncbi:aerobic ribonucleoside diphosphate reductase large subunit [Escherichia phage vB_EcoS_ESCO30]|uniref:Ribonucleoside-diphosphate reductase n=1 Tax=Escherichia phage vB_EcoS_ESCO30 TaxID=2918879 RepID=A0AAE9HMP6_9CAUD|nr:aerobic ribonucleoside diphosphate reductase large subunit [Escherichia phage vB_EcoS_ESCO30]